MISNRFESGIARNLLENKNYDFFVMLQNSNRVDARFL